MNDSRRVAGPLWFERPVADREPASRPFDGLSIGALGLPRRVLTAIVRARLYDGIGQLMRAGQEVAVIRNVGSIGLAEIDAALSACFDGLNVLVKPLSLPSDETYDALDRLLTLLGEKPGIAGMAMQELGWPMPLVASLRRSGVASVRDLITADRAAVLNGLYNGASDGSRGTVLLERVLALPEVPETADIVELWRSNGVTVLPEGYGAPNPMSLCDAVHAVIRVWSSREKEQAWVVLQHRYQLLGAHHLSLQQLGDAYGITRERIRQLQSAAVRHVGREMRALHGFTDRRRLHPEVATAIASLDAIGEAASTQPMRESDIAVESNRILALNQREMDGVVRLLLHVRGLRRLVPTNALDPVWHKLGADEASTLSSQLVAIHRFLTQATTSAHTELEVVLYVNRELSLPDRLTIDGIRPILQLCSTLEELPDGRYRGRIDALGLRTDQVLRVLEDRGVPTHLDEIARELNHRLHRRPRVFTTTNLSNQMSSDGRFVPIGRSGQWALTAWPNVETDSVLSLIARCLEQHNRPMTANEIHAWISVLRPAQPASVDMYLGSDRRFARVGASSYGLASWRETAGASTWDVAGVAEFAASVFRRSATRRLPFSVLRDAVAEAAGVTPRRAAGLLAHNPSISTSIGRDGVRYAAYDPGYRTKLATWSPRKRGRGTLLLRLSQRAAELLHEAPDGVLRLVDLRNVLMAEFDAPSGTIYAYLKRVPEIRQFESPDRRGKMVRLAPFLSTQSGS